MGTLVGSYASVARMLDDVASVPGTDGVLLTFDDFLSGIDAFGERIQPLMRCRDHMPPLPARLPDDYAFRPSGIPDLPGAKQRADRRRYAKRLCQPGRVSRPRRI
jgi:hypothetical protein